MARQKTGRGAAPQFGGDWTSAKLDVLARYLESYTTALQDKPTSDRPFRKAYIDAFAGTGYRKVSDDEDSGQGSIFTDLTQPEQNLLEGSARLALRTTPRFDRYIFIERDAERCEELERLRQEFPEFSSDILIRQGDANEEIRELCKRDWRSHRAVVFLDPYGMQVEWSAIEAIAGTKAIDMWLLFPLGIGVNRLLTRSGDIPESWKRRLSLLLGTENWYDEFYEKQSTTDMFGEEREIVAKSSMEVIGRYFNDRLEGIFAGVSEPGILRNSVGNPLYLLWFAVGNERGKDIALRIARHLLRGLQ